MILEFATCFYLLKLQVLTNHILIRVRLVSYLLYTQSACLEGSIKKILRCKRYVQYKLNKGEF